MKGQTCWFNYVYTLIYKGLKGGGLAFLLQTAPYHKIQNTVNSKERQKEELGEENKQWADLNPGT